MKTELKFHRTIHKVVSLTENKMTLEPQTLAITLESCPEVTESFTRQFREIILKDNWKEE